MIFDFLTPSYLEIVSAEINKEKKHSTPALNMFFKRKQYAESGFVKVPNEVFNVNDILPLIERGAKIEASALNTARTYTTYELKLFGDTNNLSVKDIEDLVKQLTGLKGITHTSKKSELARSIVEGMLNKVNATREFMACSAILGSIVDSEDNEIETFDIPAENKLGTKTISDGSVKSYQLLEAMKKQMRKATKYSGKVALAIGEDAYDVLQNTDEYQNWANRDANNISVEDIKNGVEGFFGNKKYPFILLDETYAKDSEGLNFFDTNSIVMCPVGVFAEFYTAINTRDGSFAKLFHLDVDKGKFNPDGDEYRVQCTAMPIVTLPNAIVTAQLN